MAALAEIYWVQFKTSLAVQLQYRASNLIWLIGRVVEPVMYLVVWSAVARAQGGSVGSFSTGDLAAYYILFMIVNQLTFSWIMWEYEYRIKDGLLAGLLLRPLHPIHQDIADNLAYKVTTSTALLPVAVLLAFVFHPTFHSTWWGLLAFMPALILAFVLRFTLDWTLAQSAFWTTRTSALNQFYFTLMFFLAGRLAPLDLFPQIVQQIGYLLPFRWMTYFPVEVALGRLSGQETITGLLAQGVWIALSVGLLRVIWNAGVKQFSAVGS
ncbi:MAG: ABC-2 family transporter protein [Caldilineaceae bacterium]